MATVAHQSSSASLTRISPAFLLVIIAVADGGRFADPDLWWHLSAGESVIRTGHFIMRDPFSYTAHGLPWLDHERIPEVIMAAAYLAGGVIGLKLFKLACTAVTFVLIALTIAETGASQTIQSCVLMAAAVGLGPEIQFRPQLFTFICFSALMLLLVRHNYGRLKRLWLIAPLMLLWANLHGGYVAGLLAFGLYGAAAIMRDLANGNDWRKNVTGFAILWPAALAATFITPFGLNNWSAVIRTLRNPMTHGLIEEWKPLVTVMAPQVRQNPTAAILYGVVIGFMAAFIITEWLTPTLDDFPLALIAGLAIAAAIAAIRNIEIAIIASAAPLAHHAALAHRRLRGRIALSRLDKSDAFGRLSRLNQAIYGCAAIAVMLATGLFSNRLPSGIPLPFGAVNYMLSRRLTGNILCDFNWGGYVIFRLAPRSLVFTDSRYDLVYPDSITTEYLQFIMDKPGANRVLGAWPHEFVLIRPDSPAWRLMARRPDWKLLYRDPDFGAVRARRFARRANSVRDSQSRRSTKLFSAVNRRLHRSLAALLAAASNA